MSIILDPATAIVGDVLRIVTLSTGGRQVEALNLNDGIGYFRQRDQDFTFTPAASSVQYSSTARRYGGSRAVGQTHENGSVSWTCYVKGSSDSDVRTRAENLLNQINEVARGRYLEWAPGSGRSSFFELAGPGDWQPAYQVRQFIETNTVSIQITFPVLPLVQWLPMTILDDYSVDSTADYTYDALAATNTVVTGGVMTASGGSLTTERRLRHTARGYQTLGGQRTQKFTPGATISGFKGGVILRASGSSTYVEVYVDDNGTNSRLRIDVVIAGVRTNRQTNNLVSRISNGTPFWVRGRIENGVVTAEYFTAAPTPMGTPTLTATGYTLAGGEVTSLVAGYSGLTWIPQTATATTDDFEFLPFVRRNQTLPQVLSLDDVIPGDAPALGEVTVTPSGGTTAPSFAMLAWAPRAGTPVAGVAPFGILEAESAGDLSGWVSAANAGSRSGNRLIDATVSGAETYTASWTIDPSTLIADDFTAGELLVELWAVVVVSSTLVSPKLTASVRPVDGLNFGSERFTLEWGSAGRTLVIPSSGEKRRMTRVGTLLLEANALRPRAVKLWLGASTAVGSTGTFGVDYLMPVLARARALSPTGVALDNAYPRFVSSTSETAKTIRADLSGAVAAPPANTYPDHGLGGNLLELPEGPVDMLVKLSSLVPDDPTLDATDEQLAHTATVSVSPVPRSFMLRS